MPTGIVFGEHMEPLTLKMTLGFGSTYIGRRVDSAGDPVAWSGPTVLEFAAADVADITATLDGSDATFVIPVETVALLHAATDHAVRLTDAGAPIAGGRISWLPRSGWDGEASRVQSAAFVVQGPPGPTAVSTDAGNAAALGTDSLIYVGEEQIETAVEDYLTANPPAAAPDADATTKGILRLTGDLGGTADSPTVPGLAGKANTSHTHVTGDVTGLDAALAGKASTSHTHVIADTTGLQSALDGKAASSHTHTLANITDAGDAAGLDVGTTAGTVAAGDDARLSDARTPTAHTHDVDDIDATGTADSTTYLRGDGTWATPAGGGGGVTDHGDLTGLSNDDHTQYALADGSRGSFAAPLGADDNYVTDAEKAALHGHSNLTALDNVSGVNTGDQDLSGYALTSSLGTAAAADTGDFATAAQGALADTATQPGDLGTAAAEDVGAFAPASHTTSTDHDARYVTVVEHGSASSTARPAGATAVLWIGSVEPENAVAGDQWDNASGTPSVYIEEPASDGTNGQVLTTDGSGGRTWTTVSGAGDVTAADVDSEAATDGYVLTADGAGGAAWEAVAGGGSDPWTYLVATVDTDSGSTGTAADITGLTVSDLPDGLYEFKALILGVSLSSGAGIQPGIVTPTGCTATVLVHGTNGSAGQNLTFAPAAITAGSYTGGFLNAPTVSSTYVAAEFVGTVRASSMSGALKMTIKSEISGGGSNAYAKADSFMAYRRIAD